MALEPLDAVRLLIADVSAPPRQILTDDQVNGFLEIAGDVVKLAAAEALEAIATSEALVSKVIRTQDLQTDGAKLAESLMKRADRLRAQAVEETDGEFVFDVVPATSCVPERTHRPYYEGYPAGWTGWI